MVPLRQVRGRDVPCWRPLSWDTAAEVDNAAYMCWPCFEQYHDPDMWVCDWCGGYAELNAGWNVAEQQHILDGGLPLCSDCANWEQMPSPPPKPLPQQQPHVATPQTQAEMAQNRKNNLHDREVLRKQFPTYCTYHLFHVHVLGRPESAGCDRAEKDAIGCFQGGRERSHGVPEGLLEAKLYSSIKCS